MRRDFSGSSFSSDPFASEEEVDPRVGLVNLADVMLVFACGLMVAIVAHWNVNLSEVQAMDESSMAEIDNVEDMVSDMQSGAGGFVQRGQVYQDPETGQLYLLEDEER